MSDSTPDGRPAAPSLFEVFDAVVDLPVAERAAALDAVCRAPDGAADRALREQVEAMPEADAEAGRLDVPAADGAPIIVAEASEHARPTEAAGAQVGAWRLLRQVGQGGMGAVYLAERTAGGFEQRGALKRLLPAGAERVRRFEQERQILAGLTHPGIARLLDGGLAPSPGHREPSPYLVVEYVEGEPITDYAAQAGLGVRDRVRLFLQVCDAVGHAHQHLVVHRDLKPSNVLAAPDPQGGAPQTKLLDFGIAKLLAEEGDALTLTGFPALTPEYAAPEQVSGGAITTATDVYALGVLLFELLAGKRPYVVERGTLSGVVEAICRAEPAPLHAAAEPHTDRRALRGDLTAIVAKALAKEPARRYRSASELADDLRRHLDGLPVEARAPTAAYRVGRFVRRHRGGVAAAALVAALLLGGGVLYTVRVSAERTRAQAAALRAEEAAQAAELAAFRSAQTSLFLENVLTSSDPTGADPGSVTARELLDVAAARARADSSDDPIVPAQALNLVARVYLNLGLYDEAAAALDDAIDRFVSGGDDPLGHRDALLQLANLRYRQDRFQEAETHAEEALRLDSLHAPPEDGQRLPILNTLALAYSDTGREERSVEVLRELIGMRRAGMGDNPGANLALNLNNLGLVLLSLDRVDEAAPVLDEAVALAEEHRGPEHPYVAFALNARSGVHEKRGDVDEALADLERAEGIGAAALGADHPFVAHVRAEKERIRGAAR